MNNKLVVTLVLILTMSFGFAQTKEELQVQKSEKQAVADAAQKEANALQAQIEALPGWKKGAFGVIGGSLSNFNNWYAQGTPNNSSGNIGVNFNAFANKLEDSYFWRNSLTVNLAWENWTIKTVQMTTTVFNQQQMYLIFHPYTDIN